MWMGCNSQQEIADEIGYSKQVVSEFLDSVQLSGNGTGSISGLSSENPQLTETREFVSASAFKKKLLDGTYVSGYDFSIKEGSGGLATIWIAPAVVAWKLLV